MPTYPTASLISTLVLAAIVLVSCSGNVPASLGVSDAKLAPCPASPNCVSSDAQDHEHRITPLYTIGPPEDAWMAARNWVANLPRTRIVTERADYLHAECRSALFGFVDDLELNLRPSERIIAVRSAARLGYSDFGVNRRRVEALRAALIRQGVGK
ncbi:MAG TPA: DUF1499 domain-containing protein [Desulfomicrobiaceae bacterium]|jgi:uncharacterized protein (DUF1499 family)|nr:DUF1499 domain-containing protein [Desulfomicrobiaceae bacterium]MBZ4647856.1 hypothetical protein [Desulfomicrobiaceae bacterium]HCF05083.1 DUF1499 domain-containing protein [Desulfomicrobiaceae bacterium]